MKNTIFIRFLVVEYYTYLKLAEIVLILASRFFNLLLSAKFFVIGFKYACMHLCYSFLRCLIANYAVFPVEL